jgi:hypothetical protein
MTRQRTLTELELIPTIRHDEHDWVTAKWTRADGTKSEVVVQLRDVAKRWKIAWLLAGQPTGELLRDVPLARIEAAVNADERIRKWLAEGVKRKQAPRSKLKPPASRRLDDPFYLEVALAYADAVAHGLRPAKTLAEDTDTPQGTVNRWIAKAREKKFLPATTPGRARA